jgi:hypothetical protein
MNYDKNQLLHESALDFRRQVAVCVQRERHDLRRFVKTWSTNANSPCLTVEFDNSVMVRIATCTWFLFCVHALLSKLGGKPKLHCESASITTLPLWKTTASRLMPLEFTSAPSSAKLTASRPARVRGFARACRARGFGVRGNRGWVWRVRAKFFASRLDVTAYELLRTLVSARFGRIDKQELVEFLFSTH